MKENVENRGISIVVPFLNEEEIIERFCFALDEYQGRFKTNLELVFVDDGSQDQTTAKIRQYLFHNISQVKIVSLSKNYGTHAAARAGLMNVSYDIVTWLGSDLQDPLEILELGLEKIEQGYDAVYFEKKAVKVSMAEKTFSNVYSWLMRKYAVKEFGSGGINTIMMNRKVLEVINSNVESNSSIVLQILNCGFRHTTIPLDYHERSGGKSKWTLSKKIKLFIDSFVAFSFMPIRLVSLIGILMFLVGCIIGVSTIINRIINPLVPIGYSTLASIVSLGFGITNISLGIMAEYLWRAYDAARDRPAFIVSEVVNVVGGEGGITEGDACKNEPKME